jgi:hypothetical protein
MWTVLLATAWVAGFAVAFLALGWLAVRAVRRLYASGRAPAERSAGGGGAVAGLLGEFQQIVEPQVRHVREEREQRRAESGGGDSSDR